MVIDYKMLLVGCLCWFRPMDSVAALMADLKTAGADYEATSAEFLPGKRLLSDARRPRHYVIIGAFRELKNADKLIRRVTSVGFEPKYFLNKEKRLYYVYIVIYDDIKSAHRVSAKLRDINFIEDAWVFSTETGEPLSERLIASAEVKSSILLSDAGTSQAAQRTSSASASSNEIKKENRGTTPSETTGSPAPEAKKAKPKEEATPTTFKSTSSAAINQLVRADKGDIVVFNNLLFHKNSSVLRKVSKDEMERLNDVLQTKSNLRIKIHGHTNGDFKGEVYLLAENDDRFFKLSGRNKVVRGDDKLLSAERAKVIKRYLGARGISGERIEIQGWGDRRMLYPKGHLKAPLNRRVEIEILDN